LLRVQTIMKSMQTHVLIVVHVQLNVQQELFLRANRFFYQVIMKKALL